MSSSPDSFESATGSDMLSWLLLTKAPALALRGRVLLLAAVGVAVVWTCDALLVDGTAVPTKVSESVWLDAVQASGDRLSKAWLAIAEPFVLLARGDDLLVNAIRCLLRIAAWGLIGGAIMRIAALSLTRDEAPDLPGACAFAWRNKASLVGGPLLLVVGLVVVAAPLGLTRLAMQISWLAAIGAVLWPILLVAAALVAVYAIGLAIGWPLTWAAVATDKSDGFDAISRMFAYVYQKPLRLAGYVVVALGLGWLAGFAVELFLAAVTYASSMATGGGTSAWAAEMVAWWEYLLAAAASVFFTAYLWTTAAAIYLLRRHDIDGVHLDEVAIDEAEQEDALPELRMGPTGVPERAEDAA